MPGRVEAAGVELAYVERGSGPAVLVIHDLASDAAAQQPLLEQLAPRARAIAYDRRGYGASGAPEPYARTTVNEQAEDAARLLGELDAAPALVVGRGLGALVALDLLLRHRASLRGAVLAEPPLYAFVPQATEELAEQRETLERTLREHGPEQAVEAWLAGRASGEQLARARSDQRAFFADFAGLTSWPVTRRELRSIAAPLSLVTAPDSPPHALKAATALEGLLAGVRRRSDGDLVAAALELL